MVKARKPSTPEKTKRSTITQSGYVTGSRKWAIAFTASLGAILEVIDTSIVNVALTEMQANLGATVSEIGWVVRGMGLYGALFAVPIFAQSILNFTATQTGLLLAPGALTSAIVMVLLGKISTKVDARILIASGAIGSALVMFQLSNITPQTGTEELFWPLVWRGAVTVLMFLLSGGWSSVSLLTAPFAVLG